MLCWIVKEVESPYGNVSTLHWAVPDTDASDSSPKNSNHFTHSTSANGDDDANEDALHRELENAEDQLGAVLWNSNSVALRHLHARLPCVSGRRVVELGAGVGCLGIALAMAGARVAVTDLKELLPLMQRNIELNAAKIKSGGGTCTAVPWRWGPPPVPHQQKQKTKKKDTMAHVKDEPKGTREVNASVLSPLAAVQEAVGGASVDFVVLCDALYGNPRDWPNLLYTLTEILAVNPKCEVINFCEQRVQDVEGAFLELLQTENARTSSGDAVGDSMESVMRRRRGRYEWRSETEVVTEGSSDLDMAVRVTRIRWVPRGKRMREEMEEEGDEKGESEENLTKEKKKEAGEKSSKHLRKG